MPAEASPFGLRAQEVANVHSALARGRKTFAWTEAALLGILESPRVKTEVYWAVLGLRACGTTASLPALRKLVAESRTQDVRTTALLGVAHLGGTAETPYLAEWLGTGPPWLQEYAMWAISAVGDERALPAVRAHAGQLASVCLRRKRPSHPLAQQETIAYLFRVLDEVQARSVLDQPDFAPVKAAVLNVEGGVSPFFLERVPGFRRYLRR